MKRTPLKRSRKPLKRTRLKRGKPYKRTEAQIEYHANNPLCYICRAPGCPTPHHIDCRKLREDTTANTETLCPTHHVFNEGVHVIGIKRFVEKFGLQDDPKWEEVYSRVRNK